MPGDDGSPQFDEAAQKAVDEWRKRTGANLELMRRIVTGGTDDDLFSATLSTPLDGYREIIVKRCRPRPDGGFESVRLNKALAANREFAERHLVTQVCDPLPVADGGTVLLQQIANDSLENSQTLAQALQKKHGWHDWTETVKDLTRQLIDGWGYGREPETTDAKSLLRSILKHRLSPEGKLAKWLEMHFSAALNTRNTKLRIFGERSPLANPWALASDETDFGSNVEVQNWTGNSHGDLHPGNIIVPKDAKSRASFRLIDLSRFEEKVPLTLDPTYLRLTAIAPRLMDLEHNHRAQAELVDLLVARPTDKERWDEVEPDMVPLLREVRSVGDEWLKKRGVAEKWHRLNLLALCANGLILTSRNNLTPELQEYYFRIACRAADELLGDEESSPAYAKTDVEASKSVVPLMAIPPRPQVPARPQWELLPREVDVRWRKDLGARVERDTPESIEIHLIPVEDLTPWRLALTDLEGIDGHLRESGRRDGLFPQDLELRTRFGAVRAKRVSSPDDRVCLVVGDVDEVAGLAVTRQGGRSGWVPLLRRGHLAVLDRGEVTKQIRQLIETLSSLPIGHGRRVALAVGLEPAQRLTMADPDGPPRFAQILRPHIRPPVQDMIEWRWLEQAPDAVSDELAARVAAAFRESWQPGYHHDARSVIPS
ncbi:hypothetical protein [Actinoplanes sp. NPDC049802]|uniref:hypothetical protein n=1 Tax=Actinoplanes sp. NPDC049802 TaxID=3154742 RepID=UPI0033FCEC71